MSGLKVKWRNGIAYLDGTINGKRIRKSLGTCDSKIAENARAQEEARLQKAKIYGSDHEATFADACVLYQQDGGERRYLAPIIRQIGKRRLATIKPGEIRSLAKKLKPNCKASTRNRHVIVPVRAVINFAHDHGFCAPIKIRGFKEVKAEKHAIDREWVDKFRKHAAVPGLRTLVLFIYVTAARIGEAVALTSDDFNFDEKWARIDETKNGDYRYFHLTNELVRELRLLKPREANDGTMRIFGYSSPNSLIWSWKKTCERAGIRYVTRHEAGRHSFATELVVRQGIDVVTAAKLGGWKNPKTLLQKYAHAENLGEIAEAVFGTELTQPNRQQLQAIENKRGKGSP